MDFQFAGIFFSFAQCLCRNFFFRLIPFFVVVVVVVSRKKEL